MRDAECVGWPLGASPTAATDLFTPPENSAGFSSIPSGPTLWFADNANSRYNTFFRLHTPAKKNTLVVGSSCVKWIVLIGRLCTSRFIIEFLVKI